MNNITHIHRMKMMIDSILLLKQNNGWDKVHHNIRHSSLYLKKTFRDIIPSDMIYETILRANTTVFFAQGKTFTWLKRVRDWNERNVYYYCPPYLDIYQDVYSTSGYGYFLDDHTNGILSYEGGAPDNDEEEEEDTDQHHEAILYETAYLNEHESSDDE